MLFDDWLTLAQTVAILLLWLFYIGRWVGRQDRPTVSTPPPPSVDQEQEVRLKTLEDEMGRARERLHKLEGFRGTTDTKLRYIERDLERLKNDCG